MRAILMLSGSLLRGGGRRTFLDLILTVVGVAIPVAITVLVVGTVVGFDQREDAMAWREPTPADTGQATALQRRSYQPWDGERIDVVELSTLSSDAPHPPGIPDFPDDGEIWVSDPLQNLLTDDGRVDIFENRLDGSIAGTIGREALSHRDELVAVVGNTSLEETSPDDRLGLDHRVIGGFLPSDVVAIDGFAGTGSDPGLPTQYRVAAWIAGALLVAPSISLLAAGARLTAARRGRRLAALRLVGATSRQVTSLAAIETALGSAIGIVLGIGAAVASIAALRGIPLGGGRFEFSHLIPDAGILLLIGLGALALAVVSALAGLRSVRVKPLGVVRQASRRRPALSRLLVLILAWAGFVFTVLIVGPSGGTWLLVGGLGVVILSISAVGPVFAWALGWITQRLARRPGMLVAGRRLMADPVGSFRPTTGLILVAFVAGFLLISGATLPRPGDGGDHLILGNPITSVDDTTKAEWKAELTSLYPRAEFGRTESGRMSLTLPADTDIEREREAIQEITGSVPVTQDEADYENLLFAADVRKATAIVVVIALIQAAFATGVGAAASVLEQANTLAALHLGGTPRSQLQWARILQGAIPITTGAALSVIMGVLAGGLTIIGVRPEASLVAPSLLYTALVVVAASAAAAGGTLLTTPILRSVLRQPLSER